MALGGLTRSQTSFVILSSYLIFSLNFLGIIAHGRPNSYLEKWNKNWNHNSKFRSRNENGKYSRTNPSRSGTAEDPIDLLEVSQMKRQGIDKFDAYGDYEYVDGSNSLNTRRQDSGGRYSPIRRRPPPRRIHRYPQQPYRHPFLPPSAPPHLYHRPPQRPTKPSLTSFFRNPLKQLSFLSSNSIFGNEGDYPLEGSEAPLGEKKAEELEEDDYEYGDYTEGYDNSHLYIGGNEGTVLERISDWFSEFKPKKSSVSPDYANYDVGDDHNLIYYDSSSKGEQYSFQDVLHSVRKNESTGIIIKKFLSAASALSERSGSDPVFMLWTIPTTLFALLGTFYFLGAMAILGYKYVLFLNDSSNGQAVNLLPVIISFFIPTALAIIFVTSRSVINGEILPKRVMRGDFRHSLRPDFDGIHFGLDSVFGTSALLGIGWIISIAV